jgi:hypothetical protein
VNNISGQRKGRKHVCKTEIGTGGNTGLRRNLPV